MLPGFKKAVSDKWQTPSEIYEPLNERFKFTYDPCPIDWEEGDKDGLTTEWRKRNFVNPPYSNTSAWIKKCYDEYKKGRLVVLLTHVITDTKAFSEFIAPYAEVEFIQGRVKFLNEEAETVNSSPKPSMISIFDPNKPESKKRKLNVFVQRKKTKTT
jgi:phage N-6-adenine-methyltransferase